MNSVNSFDESLIDDSNQISCFSESVDLNCSQSFGAYLNNCDYSEVINVIELNQLKNFGVADDELDDNKIRFTSDQWISIYKNYRSSQLHPDSMNSPDEPKWSSVKMLKPYQNQCLLLSSNLITLATINPLTNLIAILTLTNRLYVFQLFESKCIKVTTLSGQPQLCTWLDSQTIGLVINNWVFKWSIFSQASNPVSIFQIDTKLLDYQLKELKADATIKWFALLSLSPSSTGKVKPIKV